MKVIHTMIKPAHDTHKRVLSPDVQIVAHHQTDDLNHVVQFRNANPDCVIVVSRRVATQLIDVFKSAPENVVVDLSNLYCLVDQPDQDTLNQPFNALFRPVVKTTQV